MYAIRIVGDCWIQAHDSYKAITCGDLQKAEVFRTREEALTVVMLTVPKYPDWIGNVRVVRLKKIRRHKVMHVQEPLQVWMEEVDHLVAV
jgi:hypothetical protein